MESLSEPLLTFSFYTKFIEAGKCENYNRRLNQVHRLVQQLPSPNQRMLEMLLFHLSRVVLKSDKNLMTVANVGVCFGPTLLRAEEETVAAIMDIKFANVVVEILIQNWEVLLKTKPDSNPPPKPSHSKSQLSPSTSSPVKSSPTVKPPPYIPPPPPAHNSPPTLVQTVIFEGPKVVQASTVQQTSPSNNGPGYATWERTLRGGPPPTQPSTRSSVSSSLSNLSSVSTISSTPTGLPWYRASAPPGRAAQLQQSRQASQLVSQPSQVSSPRDDSSHTARSSRGSSTSSTDSLASWSSKETGGHSVASFSTGDMEYSVSGVTFPRQGPVKASRGCSRWS